MFSLPFLTNYLQLLNIFTTVTTTIASYVLILIDYSRDNFFYFNVFIVANILVFSIFCTSTSRDNIGRESLYFRFLAISICGVVAKIRIFYIWNSDWLSLYYNATIFNTISLCFYIPVYFSIRKFQLIYHKHYCLILFGTITHIITLAYGISKAFEYESWFWVLIFQVYYTLFTLSAVDFFVTCVGEIEDYVNELEPSSPIVVVRDHPPVLLRFNIPPWFTVADVMDYQAALQG